MVNGEDFLSTYLAYASDTEVPAIFHRWSAIAGIGAMLGRQFYLQHGHFKINPNIYCMLVGSPGTRKSTAIKLFKKLIVQAGYRTIAANKTTKEKFLLDLAGETEGHNRDADAFLDGGLFGDATASDDKEMFIMADEFNNFFGNGNIEFLSLLGDLWDFDGVFENRIKNGKSVLINNPTISILGGNTPTNIALAFPAEIFGQGFFSRMLFIYGEPNGRRIAFPKSVDDSRHREIAERLRSIKECVSGPAILSKEGEGLLERIYNESSGGIDDVRFESYSNRRFSHLLKLCLVVSASRLSTEIRKQDVLFANTILSHAEYAMPKALGEFGKARHSDVSHRIVQKLESSNEPLNFYDLWEDVQADLERLQDLQTLLSNLVAAKRIQSVAIDGKAVYMPCRRVLQVTNNGLVDYSLLTEEERRIAR